MGNCIEGSNPSLSATISEHHKTLSGKYTRCECRITVITRRCQRLDDGSIPSTRSKQIHSIGKNKMAKTTKKPVAKKVAKKVTKKAPANKFWFEDVGDNVMRNAEQISANIQKNAKQLSDNIAKNSARISANIKALSER